MENIVIGIEGTVGAGKTSICRELLKDIENSIILPYARVRRGAYIKNSVVGEHADIGQDVVIGCEQGNIPRQCSPLCGGGITLVGKGIKVAAGARVQSGVMLDFDVEPSEVGKLQV